MCRVLRTDLPTNLKTVREDVVALSRESEGRLSEEQSHLRLKLSGVHPIARVHGPTLTYAEFLKRYAEPGVPIIITNYTDRLPSSKWSPSKLRKVCGHRTVTFHERYQEALDILEDGGLGDEVAAVIRISHNLTLEEYRMAMKFGMTLNEYMDYMAIWEEAQIPEPKHLIDYFGMPFSIHTQAWAAFCPEFLKDFKVPRFFPVDYMATNPGLQAIIGSDMPEAFIAPRSSVAYPMHLHPFSTSVWLQLLEGRKRWWLFPYLQNVDALSPYQAGYTFDASPISPDYVLHPEFRQVQGWEGVLEAGELLFMPAGMVHQVLNEETSYMVSFQYLDFAGLETMWKLPEKYSENKDMWRAHLAALGLQCWIPKAADIQRLGRQGDLRLEQVLSMRLNPTLPKMISKSRCSSTNAIDYRRYSN